LWYVEGVVPDFVLEDVSLFGKPQALLTGIQIEDTIGSGTHAHKQLFVNVLGFPWVPYRTRSCGALYQHGVFDANILAHHFPTYATGHI
jgi:hypothetical protein